MTTLQGMISKAVDNSNVQLDALGYLTTNVSNMNTWGYKAQRFENYMQSNGHFDGVIRTDYQNGILYNTSRQLDVAVDGPGFFPVTSKTGQIAYTRDGGFKLNAEGYIVTSDGSIVGDGIKIPPNTDRIKISQDGTVKVSTDVYKGFQVVGKIPIAVFNNNEGLKTIEGNKVLETKESGKATLLKTNVKIAQGKLERSNVDLVANVNDTLRLNASLISSTRMIKFVDDIYRQAISLKQ